jgi:hypothetical protein
MNTKPVKFHNQSNADLQNITIEIPYLCPHCKVSNNPVTNHLFVHSYQTGEVLSGFIHRCTSCAKLHFSLQMIKGKSASFISGFPSTEHVTFGELISEMSPRFVDLYNQANTSEENSHFDLAGMGYRASLEVLIKDYALEFELDSKEEISKLNLNNAIGKYFKSEESIISADVVRKLGNGYAHWENEHDDLPLEVLKTYLEIFIKQIEVKLMLKNPPVPTRLPNP